MAQPIQIKLSDWFIKFCFQMDVPMEFCITVKCRSAGCGYSSTCALKQNSTEEFQKLCASLNFRKKVSATAARRSWFEDFYRMLFSASSNAYSLCLEDHNKIHPSCTKFDVDEGFLDSQNVILPYFNFLEEDELLEVYCWLDNTVFEHQNMMTLCKTMLNPYLSSSDIITSLLVNNISFVVPFFQKISDSGHFAYAAVKFDETKNQINIAFFNGGIQWEIFHERLIAVPNEYFTKGTPREYTAPVNDSSKSCLQGLLNSNIKCFGSSNGITFLEKGFRKLENGGFVRVGSSEAFSKMQVKNDCAIFNLIQALEFLQSDCKDRLAAYCAKYFISHYAESINMNGSVRTTLENFVYCITGPTRIERCLNGLLFDENGSGVVLGGPINNQPIIGHEN